MRFFLGDKFYIKCQNEVLKVMVIWESNVSFGAECRTGQGKFEIRVSQLEVGLLYKVRVRFVYIRLVLLVWL